MKEFHEVSNIFPLLQGKEYEELKADIAANGLIEDIWLSSDGKIIDGRNRYKACMDMGIEPRFRIWEDRGSIALVNFVVSLNLHRRHLSSGQRAALAVDVLAMLETEAKERQRINALTNQPQNKEKIPYSEMENKGQARDQAATLFKTNGKYVDAAKKLKDEAPDLFESVKTGDTGILKAKKDLKKRKEAQKPKPKANKKSPILYVHSCQDMHHLLSESVDIIITSPPYNLKGGYWPMKGSPRPNGIGYNDDLPEKDYQEWQLACLREMYRVAKKGASLFYNHKVRNANNKAIHPTEWLLSEDNPWVLRQEIIWDRKSTHNHNKEYFWPQVEMIYWLTKEKPSLYNESINQKIVWQVPVSTEHWHPAPFPVEIPENCLKAIGGEKLTVLDPFAGSCTTLKAALALGHEAVGYDVSEEYVKRAKEENGWS